ncbi:MAG: hypothetical protein H7317_17390 [Pseudorhodobacter sp.]|nr:hypothetical protein [Pseudorhodobacter sp.]
MTYTILTLTAAYALVAALLAFLLLMTRLHWVFKALATVATVALIPLTFIGVGELRGLPSDGDIPSSFQMLWAQVVEPNALHGEKGHVFLWLQAMDADNYPQGQPRAYQLPYSDDLKIKVNDALVKISQGDDIQGKVDAKKALPEETSEALAQEIKTGMQEAQPGGSATVGERIMTFQPSMLSFTPKAAPITPGKSP